MYWTIQNLCFTGTQRQRTANTLYYSKRSRFSIIITFEDVPVFDHPLETHHPFLYDDNIEYMLGDHPKLVNKCKQLSITDHGQNYVDLRMPVFVLESNKLEVIAIPGYLKKKLSKFCWIWWNPRSSPSSGSTHSSFEWMRPELKRHEPCKVHRRAFTTMNDSRSYQNASRMSLVADERCASDALLSRFHKVMAGTYILFPNKENHEQSIREVLEKRNALFQKPPPWCVQQCGIVSLCSKISTNNPFSEWHRPNGLTLLLLCPRSQFAAVFPPPLSIMTCISSFENTTSAL